MTLKLIRPLNSDFVIVLGVPNYKSRAKLKKKEEFGRVPMHQCFRFLGLRTLTHIMPILSCMSIRFKVYTCEIRFNAYVLYYSVFRGYDFCICITQKLKMNSYVIIINF